MGQIRKHLVEELIKEILGPRNGPSEILENMDPAKEYITGVIIPKTEEKESNPDTELTEPSGGSNESSDDTPPEYSVTSFTEITANKKPSSFGYSFSSSKQDPKLSICISYGRYSLLESENENEDYQWQRTSNVSTHNIVLSKNERIEEIHNDTDGKIILYLRKISDPDGSTVVVYLVNDLNPTEYPVKASRYLFQPSIRINFDETDEVNVKKDYREVLDYLYRESPTYSKGFLCSTVLRDFDYWGLIDPKILWADGFDRDDLIDFQISDIRSEFVPLYPISSPEFDLTHDGKKITFSTLDLSEMWELNEIDSILNPLVESYKGWMENNRNNISNKLDESLIEKQNVLYERMKKGISIIIEDENARLCFNYANKVIDLQRKWKKPTQQFSWRPFQLAFVLANIESIVDKNSDYRNVLDLLWIPTGGGKTEAYLALMAFTFAYRRRIYHGDKTNHFGYGVSIITRYTLRLLTVQQFRRTLLMVTAAEYLRVIKTNNHFGWRPEKCTISDNWIFGTQRFSVGLWVGSALSPNHRVDAIKSLNGGKIAGEPAQVVKCPICDSWLVIPKTGLSRGTNRLHVIVKSEKPIELLTNELESLKDSKFITNVIISVSNLQNNYYTVTLTTKSENRVSSNDIDDVFALLTKTHKISTASFRASRPGYYKAGLEPGRKNETPLDFDILCTNPECVSNDIYYIEEVPLNQDSSLQHEVDGLFTKTSDNPFKSNKKMPITAYTIDEQVYHRIPTIIISTVDKIARLSYEPRAGSMVGNVNKYNANYGYLRNGLHPRSASKQGTNSKYEINIPYFQPPDLIVQDELHLIEGPLGSMYGHYEMTLNALIDQMGGKPKHIASTATAKDIHYQISQLYNKEVHQFPPYGLTISDSFFVKEKQKQADIWDETSPSRLYLGLFSPGMGALTPLIRIWSRLLREVYEMKDLPDSKYYWTIVGYFNALRELGGGRSIYREDILERLDSISEENKREIDVEKIIELSSRIDSTDIPQLLEDLEKAAEKPLVDNPDAIFTTSMFGTGVDIPHLSLMIVNGQPKTTSQYIQATGRVGRDHGALVISFLRAGRARDLSHYEMFQYYHGRIYSEVESPSVSPLSEGTLSRAAGPIMVAFLRNMINPSVKWYETDGKVILEDISETDYNTFKELMKNQIPETHYERIMRYFDSQYSRWKNIAESVTQLSYVEYNLYKKASKHVVLGDPQHEHSGGRLRVVFKNAPNSLREIEETLSFEV